MMTSTREEEKNGGIFFFFGFWSFGGGAVNGVSFFEFYGCCTAGV